MSRISKNRPVSTVFRNTVDGRLYQLAYVSPRMVLGSHYEAVEFKAQDGYTGARHRLTDYGIHSAANLVAEFHVEGCGRSPTPLKKGESASVLITNFKEMKKLH